MSFCKLYARLNQSLNRLLPSPSQGLASGSDSGSESDDHAERIQSQHARRSFVAGFKDAAQVRHCVGEISMRRAWIAKDSRMCPPQSSENGGE